MRWNKSTVVFLIYLAVLLIGGNVILAQENLSRTVEKNVLKSETLPPIRIKFDKKFKYAGGKSFLLFGNSQVEQYYFVLADKQMKVKQVYTVQFESFLPNNTLTYNYKIKDKIDLADNDYLVDFIAGSIQDNLMQRPDSDASRRWKYLKEKNYKLPDEVVGRRFVRLLDETKRSEILIIYQEDIQNSNLTLAEVSGERNAEKWDKLSDEIAKRSTDGFKIL